MSELRDKNCDICMAFDAVTFQLQQSQMEEMKT